MKYRFIKRTAIQLFFIPRILRCNFLKWEQAKEDYILKYVSEGA